MRLRQFRVENYRSIQKSDWIDVSRVTAFVGQNEAGKSNLCEALYRLNPYTDDKYVVDEDWPVDAWGNKDRAALVCEARFEFTDHTEIETLFKAVDLVAPPPAHKESAEGGQEPPQPVPMMIIEARLGLASDMGGLLGNRQTLVVEGGDDALVLQKLSGVLQKSGKGGLSDRIYVWPARGASNTPMYAGFLVGHKFDAGVLLDSDAAGESAKKKISDLYLKKLAEGQKFRVFMLKDVAGISKTDAAIEDLFPDDFYLECVNAAYHINIRVADLPENGSDQITKRVEAVLKSRHGREELDKRLVMGEMLKRFDGWRTIADLPTGTAAAAEKLFKKINAEFA
jgi:hypothetical protein